MSRRRFSSFDNAWWRMDDPTNLMMITGVMVFGAPVDIERFKTTIAKGLLRFDRFRQRVVQPERPGAVPYWDDDPDLDLDYHVRRVALTPPADRAVLQDVASELASTQLDLKRPLWQFHLVENYGGGSALICRLHHCIGDGIALVHVLLSLAGPEPDAPLPEDLPKAKRARRWMPLRHVPSVIEVTYRAKRTLVREGVATLRHPSRLRGMTRYGARAATAFGRLVLRWPDPKTVFKGELGASKRVAWSDPIPLADVKLVGRVMGGTVNDVLLTAATGGLRRYLEDRGKPEEAVDFRAIVPVNLRPSGPEVELGNKFGLVFLSLPVRVQDPVVRLAEVKRSMDGLKDSLEPPVTYGIVNLIGMATPQMQEAVVSLFATKATTVMTNVIGPTERLYLTGAPLESLMFWVPQAARVGMGVSILSYAGEVRLGVMTDEGLVPNPETIIDGFHTDFAAMLLLAQEKATSPSAKRMTSMLDGAIEALDGMLADGGEAVPAVPNPAPEYCQSLTKAGQPCKNRPLHGSSFCHWHTEARTGEQ